MVSIRHTLLFQTVSYPQLRWLLQLERVINGTLSEESLWQYTLLVKHFLISFLSAYTDMVNHPLCDLLLLCTSASYLILSHQMGLHNNYLLYLFISRINYKIFLIISKVVTLISWSVQSFFFFPFTLRKKKHHNHIFFIKKSRAKYYIHYYCL